MVPVCASQHTTGVPVVPNDLTVMPLDALATAVDFVFFGQVCFLNFGAAAPNIAEITALSCNTRIMPGASSFCLQVGHI